MSDFYFNGKFLGSVENPDDFVKQVVNERRKGTLDKGVNVYINKKTKDIKLDSTVGRIRRHLIIVKYCKNLMTDNHVKKIDKN